MAAPIQILHRSFPSRPRAEPVHPGNGLLGIFIVCFCAFLAVGVVAQVLMLPWRRWLPGAESETSLFRSVRAAVHTVMGYLS